MFPPLDILCTVALGRTQQAVLCPLPLHPPTDPQDQNRNQNPAHFDTYPCDEDGSNFCY